MKLRTLDLNRNGFEKYLVGRFEYFNGVQYRFRFENGYGASVVKHDGSYGRDQDLWELAVITWHDSEFSLNYDTEITDDVIGYLTDSEVQDLLKRIKDL